MAYSESFIIGLSWLCIDEKIEKIRRFSCNLFLHTEKDVCIMML